MNTFDIPQTKLTATN